jgi:hypothetical protein
VQVAHFVCVAGGACSQLIAHSSRPKIQQGVRSSLNKSSSRAGVLVCICVFVPTPVFESVRMSVSTCAVTDRLSWMNLILFCKVREVTRTRQGIGVTHTGQLHSRPNMC